MQKNEFNYIIEKQLKESHELLLEKNDGYAPYEDKLHGFRVAAKLQGTPMRHALAGMMAKHTASLYDMVQDPISYHDRSVWDEKITDHINYLLILQAVLYEERSEDDGSDNTPNKENN